MKTTSILTAGLMLLASAATAQDCAFQKPEYSAVMKELGTPPVIEATKPGPGNSVVAMVWTYPGAAHGKDVSAILIDGKVQALTVDGEVVS